MKLRAISLFFLQLALLLLLPSMTANASQASGYNAVYSRRSPGPSLTDAQIKTMLRDYIASDKLGVGLVVGIVDTNGSRVVSYGKLDNGTDANVNGNTLFEIGSITKVFTALLLQDMVDRGEMKLDDPVQKYLPKSVKMPTYHGKQITLLELATHTSGLPRDVNNLSPASWRNPGAGYTVKQAYAFLSHCKLRFEPGTKREYSNLGFALLGYVIALRAGKDYETLVRERICRPLGMDSTRVIVPPELKSRLAVGHAIPGRPVPNTDFSAFPGAGGLLSTANDLLKFVSAYLGLAPSPLSSLMQHAEASHLVDSGAKLRLGWEGSGNLFKHNGLTFGYQAELAFDTKKRRGVVVLSNCASSGIVDSIWRPLLEERSPQPVGTVPIDAALYDRYVGCYRIEKSKNTLTIRREGKRLLVRTIKPSGACYPSFEAFPLSNSSFSNSFLNIHLSFDYEGTNQPVRLVVIDRSHHTYELTRFSSRIPAIPSPVHLKSGVYDRYVGRYRKTFFFGLFHFGPTFNIRHETDEFGDHLVVYLTARDIQRYFPSLSSDGLRGGEIFPSSETNFFSPLLGIQITFTQNKKGKVTEMAIRSHGSMIHVTRISDRQPR